MVLSVHFSSIDIYKYFSDDLKLVWGLRVHICTKNFDVLVILTKMKSIFLYVTTNIFYNRAKPYMINRRGCLIDKKNLGKVKWVKYGPLTLCLR